MPYYVHDKTEAPETGTPYTSRAEAHANLGGRALTFVLSLEEQINWKRREAYKFDEGVYQHVPWIRDRPSASWGPYDEDGYNYLYPALTYHFAHLSLNTPGQIAYTPSEEHGYQDRQVKIAVGRYLEKYATDYFTREQIAEYVAQIKSFTQGLKLATTTDEIVRVYTGGPTSCMSHHLDDYSSSIHPVSVYGESDLAVAYMGELDAAKARCVVWPDKKWYTRIYGDETLKAILEANGYRRGNGHTYGTLEGARVRAIPDDNRKSRYILPYIDACCGAELDGQWMILHDHSSDGEWTTDETDGLSSTRERHYCERCNERCPEDQAYCDSCDEDRHSCENCDREMWGDDGQAVSDRLLCDRCADDERSTCDDCGRTWFESEMNNPLDSDDPLQSYCPSRCRDHYTTCDGRNCGELIDTREITPHDDGQFCDECRPRDEEDETEETPEEAPIPALRYPTIDTTLYLCNNNGDVVSDVEILYMVGCLAVHRNIDPGVPGYTITHILTGLAVASRDYCLFDMRVFASRLATHGVDWGFTSREFAPFATRAHAIHVFDTFRPGMAASRMHDGQWLADSNPVSPEEVSSCR